MKRYNVHIYREMKLLYGGIEADSHEEAARIASDRLTEEADSMDDCDGETFGALVDVAGDENFQHSQTVNFESGCLQQAASDMHDALLDAETEINSMLEDLCDEPEEDISAHRTLAKIRAAIAKVQGGNA
jgi:hypothetical protein